MRIADGKQVWAKTSDRSTHMWYSAPTAGKHVVYSILGGLTMTSQGTTDTPAAPSRVVAFNAVDVVNHKLRWTFQTSASIDLPWHLAGNDDLLIAVQGDRVMALPAE
ncbi:hypothetical protein ACFYS8_22125 [Kitasatospora sp. NPDC004615]|uniref:hypothetical protein n=1 Tax=Kitasatospora sp. NPDC004615 TaxID=3364017 RepID=UPI00368B65EE